MDTSTETGGAVDVVCAVQSVCQRHGVFFNAYYGASARGQRMLNLAAILGVGLYAIRP